jgi:exportin-1
MIHYNTSAVEIINIFYGRYYISLLNAMFEVLTDGYHKSGFKIQRKILVCMFRVVNSQFVRQSFNAADCKSGR